MCFILSHFKFTFYLFLFSCKLSIEWYRISRTFSYLYFCWVWWEIYAQSESLQRIKKTLKSNAIWFERKAFWLVRVWFARGSLVHVRTRNVFVWYCTDVSLRWCNILSPFQSYSYILMYINGNLCKSNENNMGVRKGGTCPPPPGNAKL